MDFYNNEISRKTIRILLEYTAKSWIKLLSLLRENEKHGKYIVYLEQKKKRKKKERKKMEIKERDKFVFLKDFLFLVPEKILFLVFPLP